MTQQTDSSLPAEPLLAGINRRRFVQAAVATGIVAGFSSDLLAQQEKEGMLYRAFGKTGEKISAIGLGGFHIGKQKEEQESINLIRGAIDRGITFMDNCWDYHDGGSEVRMGKALQDGYRDKVFLMTKIDGRTKAAAAKQIDECLTRLKTDRVDLMQHHEIIRMEDPDRIFAKGGAQEAINEAQKAGKIRYVGFTGHKDPIVHLRMLEIAGQNGYRFDAVQLPLNLMDAHFRSFQYKVMPVLLKENMAILGMKPLASGAILKSNTATAMECLHYALNLPTSTVITGIENQRDLDQALEATRSFKKLSEAKVAELLNKTEKAAKTGDYEKFKTGMQFDGTAKNPQWLG